VIEELDKQFQRLSAKVAGYVNRAEVVAYALNRLPALYATSERGWDQQRSRARREMAPQIETAVRQAIAAVQRDPLRTVTPLKIEEDQDAQSALQGLRHLLRYEQLTWRNLVDIVEHTLMKTARGEITWSKRGTTPVQRYDWNRYHL